MEESARLAVAAAVLSASLLTTACGASNGGPTPPASNTGGGAVPSSAPALTGPASPGPKSPGSTLTGPTQTGPASAQTAQAGAAPAPAGARALETGIVDKVVDGDTVDVRGVGRVRVVGIDTPERGECGFGPATSYLKTLVLGRTVDLVSPDGTDDEDKYGRKLRYVDVDGTDAGLAEIVAGLARARYDSRDGYGAHPRETVYIAADAAAPSTC